MTVSADKQRIADELDAEWHLLVSAITDISKLDTEKSERIEIACRVLWSIWNDEDKREAMQWASWEDVFHPGNEELAHFFELIEDRITLTSPSNRLRFYNMLLIDSDETIAEMHLLRRRHWTPITQFESRISRLKSLMREEDSPDKLAKAQEIVEPKKEEAPDPEPQDDAYLFDGTTAYWRGEPAIRIKRGEGWEIDKLRSRLTINRTAFVLKRQDSKILATNDERTVEVANVLMPQNSESYQELLEWLSSRLGVKVVG